jgi:long-chain acyl-CoA synthetase
MLSRAIGSDSLPVQHCGLDHTLSELFDRLIPGSAGCGRIVDTTGMELNHAGVRRVRDQLINVGIGYRDRVLVTSDAGTKSMEWFVAVWSLGAVLIPVDANASEETLNSIADDSGARALCEAAKDVVKELANEPLTRRRFLLERPARVTGVDLAMIIYTSGSTGVPKGIMLTHTNVLAALRAIVKYLSVCNDDVILAVPPLHFDYGLYQALFAFQSGCTTVLSRGTFSPVALVSAVERFRPTIVPVVPAIGHLLAKTLATFKKTASSVRLITNTGGHLPIGTIHALRESFPMAGVMPMYGLTESKRALFLSPDEIDHRPDSVGKPMPGLDARVFLKAEYPDGDTGYIEAKPGQIGLLYVRGSSVMQGYVDAASGGGAKLIYGDYRDDNWLCTGDLFSSDEDGYLYFHGREKDLIKQAGYCLYPREIERRIEQFDEVVAANVIGGTDENGDEIAELFVQLQPSSSKHALQTWIESHLDRSVRPRRIHQIDNWPLTSNGKIDRAQLCLLSDKDTEKNISKAAV